MYSYRGAHVNLLVSNQHGTTSTSAVYSLYIFIQQWYQKKMGKILMPIQQFFFGGSARYQIRCSLVFCFEKKAGGNNKMTNDGKSANGCLPSTHPLAAASEGPRSKQRDNGRTICLLDSKQAARTLEGQKEGDESNCYKSQSSYLIKIFFTFEARRAEISK